MIKLFRMASLALALAMAACGGGSTSPTSPSAPPGPFNGTWSGTYGGSAAVPITFTLTQSGATVTGTTVIVCSGCGDGRSNVSGTASGNVASVALTHPGQSAPFQQGITLSITGNSMLAQWRGGDGGTITGNLTSGAAPPVTTPAPPPATSTYAVSIAQSACVVLSRDSFRTYYSITASGSVTGPDNNSGLVVSSSVIGGGLQETVSCGSWAPAAASDLGVDCRRQSGQPGSTTWSVAYTNYSLGHQQADFGFVISAHAKNAATGNLSDSESVALNCAR